MLRTQVDAIRAETDTTAQNEDGRRREAVDTLEKRLAAMEKRLDGIAGSVRGIEMTIGGLADQVAKLEALPPTAAAPRKDAKPVKASARPTAPLPEELFGRAMESFKGGELGQAVLDFEEVVVKYPTHVLAGSAQFWIGEAYYSAREYQNAAVEFKKAIDISPKGEKTPEALYKLGLANRALKRLDRARDAWSQLLREFPQSDAAQRARTAMREMTSHAPRPNGTTEP
jgi:tol-pal system protein YbgF